MVVLEVVSKKFTPSLEEDAMKRQNFANLLRKAAFVCFLPLASLNFISCSGENAFIQSFSYNVNDSVLALDVHFNKSLTLNAAFTIPILNYGSFSVLASSPDQGFGIGGTLNLDVVDDQQVVTLSKTRLLPNSQPMPEYVRTAVAQLRFKGGDIYFDVYLGLDDLDHIYVGLAVELPFINQDFPSGLVLTQVINDMNNRPLGAVTLYGPNVQNGNLVVPGGFMVITNASDLEKYMSGNGQPVGVMAQSNALINAPLKPVEKTEVNIKKYEDKAEQYNLYTMFQEHAQKAGY